MAVDWDAVHQLLSISDLAHQWPKLKALNDAALRELNTHAEAAAKDNAWAIQKQAEDDAKAEAARQAESDKAAEAAKVAEAKAAAPTPTPTASPVYRRLSEETSNG